jgi:adenine-specific DNA-methyltransferase
MEAFSYAVVLAEAPHGSYNTQDMESELIYVNGDNNLGNLKKDEHTWKVRLIEEEFKRLMFEEVE